VGTGEDDRPWYKIISEKAHKEKLWEVMTRVMEVYTKESELLEPLTEPR